MLGRPLLRFRASHASSFCCSVALALLACACAPTKARSPNDVWRGGEPTSKKNVNIAELALGGGLASSAFGGGLMGVGKAIGGDQGEVTFWVGVGTLGVGVVSSFVSLVVFGVAGIEYLTGD